MQALTLTLHPSIDRILELKKLSPGALADARLLLTVPAGKGINTARSLSALWNPPGDVVAVAWVGSDKAAWFERWLCNHNGIRVVCCKRKCETRLSHTLLEQNGRETHIKEIMQAPDSNEEASLIKSFKKIVEDSVLSFCGSAPPGTSIESLRQLFASARKKAAIAIADTNGMVLQIAGESSLNGIKGNAVEIGAWLELPGPFEIKRASHRKRISEMFSKPGTPQSIMVTLGAAGALLIDRDNAFFAKPPALAQAARSATGCGDAATAGWMWALGERAKPEECLRRAVACGTAKLGSADPGNLDAKIVRKLLKETKVERL